MSDFQLINHDQATRTEVYCDTGHHITILQPQHIHSGVPADVSLTDCDCAQRKILASNEIPASDIATVHEDKVPEATGEPDLSNMAVEGDAVHPATPGEFEKLGQ